MQDKLSTITIKESELSVAVRVRARLRLDQVRWRKRPPMRDGERFGRWLVINPRISKPAALCLCDCGNFGIISRMHLFDGHSRSCGCLSRLLHTTHGKCGSRIYVCWSNMLKRCRNKDDPHFKDYGGRGIRVCERWQTFENFFSDMGEQPAGLTIERVNNDGNYEPSNCKWATQEEQSNNKRSVRLIAYKGQSMSIAQWARKLGTKRSALIARLRAGIPLDENYL